MCKQQSAPITNLQGTATSRAFAIEPHERAISALVGYCTAAAVVLPLDRIKSLMQVSDTSRRQGGVGVARTLLTQQGFRGLFKGGSVHLMIAPYAVLYYSLYDEILTRGRAATATSNEPSGHPLVPLGAALCARTFETTIRMPLEVLRTVMQTSDGTTTLFSTLQLLKNQPLSMWFRGMVPTLLRDVPFSAIYWICYEQAKERIHILDYWSAKESVRTFCHSFVCGASAGLIAAMLTTPVDVIKTVRQHDAATGGRISYLRILQMIREQPRVAFAGIGVRLVRVPTGVATMMAGIEVTKLHFEARAQYRSTHRYTTETS